MAIADRYGLPLTTSSTTAAERFQDGMDRLLAYGPGVEEAFSAVAAFSHLCLPGSDHAELMGNAIKTAINERQVAHISCM